MTIRERIREAIKALYRPGDTVEFRCIQRGEVPYVGRYLYSGNLVNALVLMDEDTECDIYLCLNPTLLSAVTVQRYMRGTKKEDVRLRRWFLLDGDPIRKEPGRVIATDSEWHAAHEVMQRAKAWLEEKGWTGIVIASSGNGVHLLVPCDLPNDAPSEHLVTSVQRAVSARFSTADVEIECFPDADRLVRAYGTLNRKGLETPTLKHRRSGLLLCVNQQLITAP